MSSINALAREAFEHIIRAEKITKEESSTTTKYLLYLASKHPLAVGFQELEEVLGITKSQVSRATRGLHKLDHHGQPGLNFINVDFDLKNPRLKLVTLNSVGLQAINVLVSPWKK